jgi:hypothetical protein
MTNPATPTRSHLSNRWNNAVAFLSMLYGKQEISTGSCFFWGHDGRTYLLTNWHNLAGRNPLTGQPKSRTGGIPDRVRFMGYKRVSAPDAHGYYELAYASAEVRLCNSNLTKPKWFEHPSLGRKVDVAALDVTEGANEFQIEYANELESDAVLDPTTSQDVFIVGFPFGLIANAPAPIWKRGSIAMDPTFNPEGLPKMLIDTATREGMSGSVVLARHIIVGRDYPKKNGTKSGTVLYSKLDLVVGIYSGRHYPNLEKAQLGIVWKRNTIEETIEARKVASL